MAKPAIVSTAAVLVFLAINGAGAQQPSHAATRTGESTSRGLENPGGLRRLPPEHQLEELERLAARAPDTLVITFVEFRSPLTLERAAAFIEGWRIVQMDAALMLPNTASIQMGVRLFNDGESLARQVHAHLCAAQALLAQQGAAGSTSRAQLEQSKIKRADVTLRAIDAQSLLRSPELAVGLPVAAYAEGRTEGLVNELLRAGAGAPMMPPHAEPPPAGCESL